MEQNSKVLLRFSEPFLSAELISHPRDYVIDSRAVVVNISDHPLQIDGGVLKGWTSSILSGVRLTSGGDLICIILKGAHDTSESFPFAKQIESRWTHVHDVFPLPHLKDTHLWRSDKHQIGDMEFNLWFARADTDCGIHNDHAFKEIHTQVFGRGHMQKFRVPEVSAMYQDVYMCPGFTHDPFYELNGEYPWHRYYAETDCIWMAIEAYGDFKD
jgi:hypothetical protein